MPVLTGHQRTFDGIYTEVQQFYARHIQLLDEGRAEDAAATFTEDASLVSPPKIPEPIQGRDRLAAGLRTAADELAAEGVRYRRCHTMMAVETRPDDRLFVRAYVQVIRTRRGGEATLHAMCVCEDILVREDGELKVQERVVTRDDCL
ncbi:nuclear transport factor 2 family protein [Streptomyces sp. NPDC048290]|uniref:nuclear transport factor 2 family protein n=1 Tax=Streptomyces sp. NPDC048290 TaxID=3155811 RepID=UPI0034455AA6